MELEKDIQDQIYSKVDELPSLPTIVPKILAIANDEKSSVGDLVAVIRKGPSLTAKILKVANSAYYGFSGKISTVEMAVSVLGFNMIKSLVISIGMIDSEPSTGRSTHYTRRGLWVHSLGVAKAMEIIGEKYLSRKEREHLYVIGLLHDIGKMVYDKYFSIQYEYALDQAEVSGVANLFDFEKKFVGLDHGEVAAMLFQRWKFPKEIVETIRYHHWKEIPEGVNIKDLAILRIANIIVEELDIGNNGNPVPDTYIKSDLELFDITDEDLEFFKTKLSEVKGEILDFYDIIEEKK